MLKLCAHKSITLARVGQNEEVDLEDKEIEQDGDHNETQSSSKKVADPKLGRDAYVAKKAPQLVDRTETNGGDGK